MDDDFFVLAVHSLVPNAKFHAACGNPDFDRNRIIKWDDEMWGFEWPHNKPTLFGRDR